MFSLSALTKGDAMSDVFICHCIGRSVLQFEQDLVYPKSLGYQSESVIFQLPRPTAIIDERFEVSCLAMIIP